MPNYYSNRIEVTGNPDEIHQLLDFIKSGEDVPFDFNKVIPYPEEFARMDAEKENSGFMAGGHEWRLQNWGTKWNAVDPFIEHNSSSNDKIPDEVTIYYQSAWYPALPVTRALSILFPNLTFTHKYEQMQMDYRGYTVCKNGEVLDEDIGPAVIMDYGG